ncbi:MAG: ATPase P, partial [Lachnospiraceae bacterium]|nr:ATPase P [Lachnospiraceae bacterium]
MIKVEIPGRDTIEIDCLVLDYNGTIANDGLLIDGVEERLTRLKQQVEIHVLTADTYGTAKEQCDHLGVILDTFPKANAADCKLDIVKGLGKGVMCIGNG